MARWSWLFSPQKSTLRFTPCIHLAIYPRLTSHGFKCTVLYSSFNMVSSTHREKKIKNKKSFTYWKSDSQILKLSACPAFPPRLIILCWASIPRDYNRYIRFTTSTLYCHNPDSPLNWWTQTHIAYIKSLQLIGSSTPRVYSNPQKKNCVYSLQQQIEDRCTTNPSPKLTWFLKEVTCVTEHSSTLKT